MCLYLFFGNQKGTRSDHSFFLFFFFFLNAIILTFYIKHRKRKEITEEG